MSHGGVEKPRASLARIPPLLQKARKDGPPRIHIRVKGRATRGTLGSLHMRLQHVFVSSYHLLTRMPTPQEFVENWPLYTRAEIVNFDVPKAISRNCEGECKKETTWSLRSESGVRCKVEPSTDFESASYMCDLCNERSLTVLYRKLDWLRRPELAPAPQGYYSINEWQYNAVQKVGQIPALSVDLSSELQKRLGPAAIFYKEGLLCRSHNLGVGAVAYMRRVIEDETDELIDVVVGLAKTYNIEANVLQSLTDAKNQIRYEDKLHVASEAIPEALRPGGVNPLGQLYKHLSVGVHGKTDEECIAIFDDLRADFEFVFRNLQIEGAERAKFAERVKSRTSKKV
jgi:hypothetical protein